MEKTRGFEIEKIIPVNVLEDKKQMRITIPAEIVEDFKIDPKRYSFNWIVQREVNSNIVTINGNFVHKQNGKKET